MLAAWKKMIGIVQTTKTSAQTTARNRARKRSMIQFRYAKKASRVETALHRFRF